MGTSKYPIRLNLGNLIFVIQVFLTFKKERFIMKFGIDILAENSVIQKKMRGKRLGLLAHPASMTSDFMHSIDRITTIPELHLCAAFGPQHGIRGEKQDNMVETEDFIDPIAQIPVFSLYGKTRKPTQEMLDSIDVFLVDVQDVGTRIYTYVTTLFYVLEAAAVHHKQVYILDRPNPVGREVEGTLLKEGWTSFVGAAPLPMRHGMTLGELACWYVKTKKLDCDLEVIRMDGYLPHASPGFGWPTGKIPWVNPSPNMPSLNTARCYPGTVLLEGTNLSEGRGTTKPLEVIGAPDLDGLILLKKMREICEPWMQGCKFRVCHFEPTFHKYVGYICSGFQIHTDDDTYQHELFKPYRIMSLCFKAIRTLRPDYLIWRDFHYEYEKDRLSIDLINGSTWLREWVDDPNGTPGDFDRLLISDEKLWNDSRKEFLLY